MLNIKFLKNRPVLNLSFKQSKKVEKPHSKHAGKPRHTSKTSFAYLKDMIKFVKAEGNNGSIFYEDFEKMLAAKYSEEEVQKAFKDFDLDGDGFITATELKTFYKNAGEKFSDDEIDKMFRETDTDGDGRLDMKEFTRAKTLTIPENNGSESEEVSDTGQFCKNVSKMYENG